MKANRWNHNLHDHSLVFAAAPRHCVHALDVESGDGALTRELCVVAERVVGIGLDRPSIESARAQGGERVAYILGDFLDQPLEPASFDLVASVAALHHVDAEAGWRVWRTSCGREAPWS